MTAKKNKNKICVLFIDLDGFKAINDRYGHDKGYVVLVTVVKRLSEAVRSSDTVSRIGGDEFVMILQNVTGISISPYHGETAEELISNADNAMYIAKKNGKNQFAFYSKKYDF